MPSPLIIDAHEDLAYNALTFNRNYTQSALATREAERDTAVPSHNGNCMIGLSELLLGRVAVVFATLFAAPLRRKMGDWEKLVYADANQAYRLYSAQLDYYHRLCDEHPQFKLIGTVRDLDEVLTSWASDDLEKRRVGLAPLMEGADGIRDPKEVEWWVERGTRIIGLAWAGTRYAGGTGEPGPLTHDGRRLLAAMADFGLILDLSHASDESFLEAVDRYDGVVIASHSNPRALLREETQRPERALSDDMIRRLASRGGVAGVVLYNRFLKADWRVSDGKASVALDRVVAMIDHVCQLAGSAEYAGLGSDFDGGFGVESAPAEIDTVADLGLVGSALRERGYAAEDVEKIMSGNWRRILRQGLPA
jgi:membrane dipeptidase